MGVKGLTHYVCQSTVASREIILEDFAREYKKQHSRQPLLVFDGESFWHVLHGTLPRIFGGQFIQFRKKAEDFCKRLHSMGFRLAFVFGNSPISADAKAEERGKQTLLHLTSFYRQLDGKKNVPQINEIWPPCLRNIFPYYLRSLPEVTVLQSLMDKDLSIACYAQEQKAAAIVSNDSDMIIFAVCPVMSARGLVTSRRRVVIMYPEAFCEDINLPIERLPLLSVYLGNQETPITTNVVEASDGVINRKIKIGDRGHVQDAIEYVRLLEEPISVKDLARDIFQEVDDENINAVRISLARYVLRERDYPFDVAPIYKHVRNSPVIEPLQAPCDSITSELVSFLDKIKKSVIKCDIILKAKAWRREFNVMHMAWPVPGSGIDDPESLYCPIFGAHSYLLGKNQHLMIVPIFESDPIKLGEPAFRKINLKSPDLRLPDNRPLPRAHELWMSQDKRLQIAALVSIWEAHELDFQTLLELPPYQLVLLMVLHWCRRKAKMDDWEIMAFLATHVQMRHFTCDHLWRMKDMSISKELTTRSVVLANVFVKLLGRFLWLVSLCGAPFKPTDLLPDLIFDGMIFQKKYGIARNRKDQNVDLDHLLFNVSSEYLVDHQDRLKKDKERVKQLFAILNGNKLRREKTNDSRDGQECGDDSIPNWYNDWANSGIPKREEIRHRRKFKNNAQHYKTRSKNGFYQGTRPTSAIRAPRGARERRPPQTMSGISHTNVTHVGISSLRQSKMMGINAEQVSHSRHSSISSSFAVERTAKKDRATVMTGFGGANSHGHQQERVKRYSESHFTDDSAYCTAQSSQGTASQALSFSEALVSGGACGTITDGHSGGGSSSSPSLCAPLSAREEKLDERDQRSIKNKLENDEPDMGLKFQVDSSQDDDDFWCSEKEDSGWPSQNNNNNSVGTNTISQQQKIIQNNKNVNIISNPWEDVGESWPENDDTKSLDDDNGNEWPNSHADESDLGACEWPTPNESKAELQNSKMAPPAPPTINNGFADISNQIIIGQPMPPPGLDIDVDVCGLDLGLSGGGGPNLNELPTSTTLTGNDDQHQQHLVQQITESVSTMSTTIEQIDMSPIRRQRRAQETTLADLAHQFSMRPPISEFVPAEKRTISPLDSINSTIGSSNGDRIDIFGNDGLTRPTSSGNPLGVGIPVTAASVLAQAHQQAAAHQALQQVQNKVQTAAAAAAAGTRMMQANHHYHQMQMRQNANIIRLNRPQKDGRSQSSNGDQTGAEYGEQVDLTSGATYLQPTMYVPLICVPLLQHPPQS